MVSLTVGGFREGVAAISAFQQVTLGEQGIVEVDKQSDAPKMLHVSRGNQLTHRLAYAFVLALNGYH